MKNRQLTIRMDAVREAFPTLTDHWPVVDDVETDVKKVKAKK